MWVNECVHLFGTDPGYVVSFQTWCRRTARVTTCERSTVLWCRAGQFSFCLLWTQNSIILEVISQLYPPRPKAEEDTNQLYPPQKGICLLLIGYWGGYRFCSVALLWLVAERIRKMLYPPVNKQSEHSWITSNWRGYYYLAIGKNWGGYRIVFSPRWCHSCILRSQRLKMLYPPLSNQSEHS